MRKVFKINLLLVWIIGSVLVFTFWFSASVLQVFKQDQSFSILSHPAQNVVLDKNVNLKKFSFQFDSRENNLGIVSVKLKVKDFNNPNTTIVRITEVGSQKIYYEKRYPTKLIAGSEMFPFGFPLINDSNKKKYKIELEVTRGNFYDTYQFTDKPNVILKYKFNRQELSAKPVLLGFITKKLLYATRYLDFAPIGIFIALFSALLFVFAKTRKSVFQKIKHLQLKRTHTKKKILVVVALGLGLRLILAIGTYNFDVQSWIKIGEITRSHINVYSHINYYNYSPLWFLVLGALDRINMLFGFIAPSFFIRAFLSFVDVVIFWLIYKIAKQHKLPPLKTAAIFFLNPVSIIITGHHGQFDNMAIALLLSGIYYSEKHGVSRKIKNRLLFGFLTAAFIMKQIVVFQVLYIFVNSYKSKVKGVILFAFSCGLFLLTLLPFFPTAGTQIIQRVFLYGGVQGLYGFTYFLGNIFTGYNFFGVTIQDVYKVIFPGLYLLFALFVTQKDRLRGMLLSVLFFLTFTSGIGAQYFVLPIAFAAFFPTRWFYLYTLAVTLFYLGSVDEFNIYTFKIFEWNTIWLFSIFWFVSELGLVVRPHEKIYKKINRLIHA